MNGTNMHYCHVPSPVGDLLLAADDEGLRFLSFPTGRSPMRPHSSWQRGSGPFKQAIEQLDAYFAGELTRFDLKLAPQGNPFQLAVWRALLNIPYGQTKSYGEIAREVGAGRIDAGITGEDLVREGFADSETRLALAARLGFGRADVVVAVPDAWYDVETMADLGEVAAGFRARHGRRLRIATKYWRLTQRHFSQEHGIQLYRIIESLGATEGAPAAGQADAIVDITSTGSTLRANRLKVLEDGVILKSEACLFTAPGSVPPPIGAIAQRLAAAPRQAAPLR